MEFPFSATGTGTSTRQDVLEQSVDIRDVKNIRVHCLRNHSNRLPQWPVFGVFALLTTILGLYLATLIRKHHAWYLYPILKSWCLALKTCTVPDATGNAQPYRELGLYLEKGKLIWAQVQFMAHSCITNILILKLIQLTKIDFPSRTVSSNGTLSSLFCGSYFCTWLNKTVNAIIYIKIKCTSQVCVALNATPWLSQCDIEGIMLVPHRVERYLLHRARYMF